MTTFFISDLHLCAARKETSELFLNFLKTEASLADALYILGDFFEVWVGDDTIDEHDKRIIEALHAYQATGIPLYFMHGNRDFLIGKQFAKHVNCTLLQDPTVISLYGKKALLTHGDLLCTLDTHYQRFRKWVRNPLVKFLFLHLPFFLRRKIALSLRKKSKRYHATQQQDNPKFDVTAEGIQHMLAPYKDVSLLIHGHTHKPGVHAFSESLKRIVLGDWGALGSALAVKGDDFSLKIIQKIG